MKKILIQSLVIMMSSFVWNTVALAANSISWQTRDAENTRHVWQDGRATFQLDNSNLKHIELTITSNTDSESWQIQMDAPNRQDFHEGRYNRLGMYPVDNHAGMHVIHRSTIGSASSMVMKEIKADEAGNIVKLAFDFRYGTEYFSVRYQSDVADDLSEYVQSAKQKSLVLEYQAPAGWPNVFSKRNDDYTVSLSMMGDHLRVFGAGYNAQIDAPTGEALQINHWYENAERFPRTGVAGLDAGPCNQSIGRFIIRELVMNKYYEVKRLAADYEYSCNPGGTSIDEMHTYGAVRVNSTVPVEIAPPSYYDANTKLLTVPFAVNIIGFPRTYQPVSLTFNVTNQNPLEAELVSVTPVNPDGFGDIHVPAGSERNSYWDPRFTIPNISSNALFGDDKAYELILQRPKSNTETLQVGDHFTFYEKKPLQ